MTTKRYEWTVLTWNIQGSKRTDMKRMGEVIGAESPDVVVLQEARRNQTVELASTLGMEFKWAFKHNPYSPFLLARSEGAAILSPHALYAAGHTVVSDITSKRSWQRRIVQWASVGRDDESAYRFYNVHLSPHELAMQRQAEAVRITEIVVEHGESPPAVVAGDLNDGDDPTIVVALPGVEHLTPSPTNPSTGPSKTLDHVLLPADAEHVTVTVPTGGPAWAALSDHLPVSVRFTLDWRRGDRG